MKILWFFLILSIVNYSAMKVAVNYHFNPKAKRRFNTFFTLLLLINGAVSVISAYSAFMIFMYGSQEIRYVAGTMLLFGIVFAIHTFLMRRGWNKIKNADSYFDITNDVYVFKKTLFSWSSETKQARWFPKER